VAFLTPQSGGQTAALQEALPRWLDYAYFVYAAAGYVDAAIGVATMLRTVPPPDGIDARANCSVFGSKRTMVLGFTPDSLYRLRRLE